MTDSIGANAWVRQTEEEYEGAMTSTFVCFGGRSPTQPSVPVYAQHTPYEMLHFMPRLAG